MKKIFIPVLCLLLVLLCACGKAPAPGADTTDASAAAGESTSEAKESVTWDDGNFLYLKGDDLPEGWTINDTFSTSTYLQADYGEGESAPRFTVSVMTYNDEMGADKAKLLADKVFDREKDNATAVETLKIGGLDFYSLSYNSLLTKDLRCYVFYGQTAPAKNKEYKFVEIQMDNIKDAKQYDELKGVLDQLSFKF